MGSRPLVAFGNKTYKLKQDFQTKSILMVQVHRKETVSNFCLLFAWFIGP
jgi:hypothetical protein